MISILAENGKYWKLVILFFYEINFDLNNHFLVRYRNFYTEGVMFPFS